MQSPMTYLYPPVRQFQSSELLALQMVRQLEVDTHRRRPRADRRARRRLRLIVAAIVFVAVAVAIYAVTA